MALEANHLLRLAVNDTDDNHLRAEIAAQNRLVIPLFLELIQRRNDIIWMLRHR